MSFMTNVFVNELDFIVVNYDYSSFISPSFLTDVSCSPLSFRVYSIFIAHMHAVCPSVSSFSFSNALLHLIYWAKALLSMDFVVYLWHFIIVVTIVNKK